MIPRVSGPIAVRYLTAVADPRAVLAGCKAALMVVGPMPWVDPTAVTV